ncbi:MAG: S49 family peptidase [Xanthobacteraceae bacterium]|nr:MAG: S49 family peptidase [Xanthobacteraceae bacterium]
MILAPHIAAHVFNVPLMVEPGKLQAALIGLGARLVEGGIQLPGVVAVDHIAFAGGRPSDSMGRIGNPLGRSYEKAGVGDYLLDRVDGIGVIPIEGTLVHKGKFVGQSSGETSYEGLQAQITRATADPSIKGVVFEVDSFGGEVAGAFETAKMIAALSDEKPTLAILTDFAMSAGYLMASAARQIVMPETGGAGSIGVVTIHTDMSRALENDGVKVTLLSSGAHKVDGHPFGPLADDVRASIQARLDRSRELFAGAVGAFRGKRLTKDAALATEAQTYFGSDAVAAGLVDGIIDPSRAFAEFHRKVN